MIKLHNDCGNVPFNKFEPNDISINDNNSLPIHNGIEPPILCLYGELSHCLPTSMRIKEIHSSCTCVEIENLGHFHPNLNPKRFTSEVLTFIMKNEG